MTTVQTPTHVHLQCDHPGCDVTTSQYTRAEFYTMMAHARKNRWITFYDKTQHKWVNFCNYLHRPH